MQADGSAMNISDNTILITGGTSGIGLELAARFLALGNTVIVTGRSQAGIDAGRQKVAGLHAIQSDVGDPAAIAGLYQRVVDEFPAMNMLINNAGIMRKINLNTVGLDLRDLTREIEINLNGAIWMVAQFLPHLKAQKRAAIVNVSSGLAFVPLAIAPVYCASKAAIHSFTLSLRLQLKNSNIIVFELAPPITATHLIEDEFDPGDLPGVRQMEVSDLVKHAIDGLKHDRDEIRPGLSNALKFMSRLAPEFILRRLGRSVDRMLAESPGG